MRKDGLNPVILIHHFLQTKSMEHQMYFEWSWKWQFVGKLPNMFDNMIGAIKFGRQLVVAMGFE
jgi:hypothetical protein